jgi:hypothetical protein
MQRQMLIGIALVAGIALVTPNVAARQAAAQPGQVSLSLYVAKFVCGDRGVPGPSMQPFDAVAPGKYYSAINIWNGTSGDVIVRTAIATTKADFTEGDLINGPVITLHTRRAAEIDCAEILEAAGRPRFLKGFVRFSTTRPVTLVGVYTAADSTHVVSIDVERIP